MTCGDAPEADGAEAGRAIPELAPEQLSGSQLRELLKDVAGRVDAMIERRERSERLLAAVGEVTSELLGGTDPAEALQLIAHNAAELTGADYAVIALPDDPEAPPEDVRSITVQVSAGGADTLAGRIIPIAGSTSGAVFLDGVPRNVIRLEYDVGSGNGPEFGPALALPLRAEEDAVSGVLLAVRAPGGPRFDDNELQVAASFADQAALALRHAQTQADRRELDVLAERDRIARDLHDHVIQRLFAIGMSMQGTHRLAKSPTVAARLAEHIDQLHEVIQELRTAIFGLHDTTGQGAPTRLRGKLHAAVTELTADTGVRTTVRMSGPLDVLTGVLAEDAEAVVREAVSNAVRHAQATELSVTVSVDDNLVIDVTDNGIGIPASVDRSGLHNLEQRATGAGGRLRVTAAGGGGTRLLWIAPLP